MAKPRRVSPRIAISMGDPSGIGPEVTAGALLDRRVRRALVPVVFGDGPTRERHAGLARLPLLDATALEDPRGGAGFVAVSRLSAKDRRPGRPTLEGGRAQLSYIHAAIAAAREGAVSALCTAPVSKEQITRSGAHFMGHTEVLAEAFGVPVLMLMDGPRVRVALATNHLPLSEVPDALTVKGLVAQLGLLSRSLKAQLGRTPRIAVCGLNPHAGEGGELGHEEVEVIAPAVRQARARGVRCEGPLPADGLFAKAERMPFDVVLAMFHDQGLIAAKALDFERTVNVTLGLPVPRTSPDHGVAYDIAGKGKASCEPMVEALLKAAGLS